MYKLRLPVVAGVLAVILFSAGCGREPEKIIDRDGNSYNTVQIGSMIWTGKNLDVTHYRNGDVIPEVKDPKEWAILTTGAWCYNDNSRKMERLMESSITGMR